MHYPSSSPIYRIPAIWGIISLLGCDLSSTERPELDVAERYIGTGVIQIAGDGLTRDTLQVFQLELTNMEGTSSEVTGSVRSNLGGTPLNFSGRYDIATGEVDTNGGEGSLTSDIVEQIIQFNFIMEEGAPEDGIASNLAGLVATARETNNGVLRTNGWWVATEDNPDITPPSPVKDMISVSASPRSNSHIIISGEPLSTTGGAAIQFIRFSTEIDTPQELTRPVDFSGEFSFEIRAVEGDILLVRANNVGRYSPAISIEVTELQR